MLSHDLIPPHVNFSRLTTSDYAELYGVIKTVKEDGFARLGLDPCLLEDELNKVCLRLSLTFTSCVCSDSTECSSTGCPGHRLGLHRLHGGYDAFPGFTFLVCHVLLHAHQPRSGEHDRHHDWNHNTRPRRLQSPEGATHRSNLPQQPDTSSITSIYTLL